MIRSFGIRTALALGCLMAVLSVSAADLEARDVVATTAQPQSEATQPPQRLSDDQLAQQRGGFNWLGVDIAFGAEIRSYMGEEMVMLTRVTWADNAAQVERTVSPSLTPVPADQAQAMLVNGISIRPGGESVFIANQGKTAFIQRTDGVIQNIIANVASNVDLRQEVDITLDVKNFGPFRNSILESRISNALSTLGGIAVARSGPN